MQVTVNNIEKLKIQNTKQDLEVETLKSLENKIQKTENMSEVIFLVIKNIQENEDIRQEENKIFEDMSNDQDQNLKSLENKNETIFTKDLIKRLETEVCDMMYNFLNKKNKINGNLVYIKFLLEILKDKNKISETNFEVLKKGIVFLRDGYAEYFSYLHKRQNIKTKQMVSEIFVKDITKISDHRDTEIIKDIQVQGKAEMLKDIKVLPKEIGYGAEPEIRKNTEQKEDKKEYKKTEYFRSETSGVEVSREDNRERQSSRRQEILKILTGEPVSIREISQKVLGCSEKTIQRELNNLLDEKIIRKEGEKRWSKYYL